LHALEAFMDLAAEILHHDAENGQRQEGIQGQPGTDTQHEHQRNGSENHRIGGIHDSRADKHANRIQVVRHPGHDVAGTGSLKIAVGEVFQMQE